MTTIKRIVPAFLLVVPIVLAAQSGGGLDPALLLKPLGDSWPTYSGDYTGRRYSSLTQINQTTVKNLGLAWVSRGFMQGFGANGHGGPVTADAGSGEEGMRLIIAGEGSGDFNRPGPAQIRGSVLMVDGVLYATSPDNAWAIDARDGTVLWHFYWKTRGGTHTGHRGVGMWHNYLFMETHDDYLVKIDARTGKEVWHVELAPFAEQYFSSMAPIIIRDHVIVGTGNDIDAPGFLQSYDPETGKRQWILYTVPMNADDPGVDTWPSLEAARHGGAQPWVPGVVRSGNQSLHLWYRQSDAGLHGGGPRHRHRLVQLFADRRERGYRQDGVVLPDLAARHARLRFGADADSDRREDQRPVAKTGVHCGQERVFLHRGSGHG